jgi:hypothetical protein
MWIVAERLLTPSRAQVIERKITDVREVPAIFATESSISYTLSKAA